MGVASGGMQFAGAFKELKALKGGMKIGNASNLADGGVAKSQMYNAKWGAGASAATALGKGGDIYGAAKTKEAEFTRAKATEIGAEAKLTGSLAQEESEFINHFADMIKDFLQKMAAVNQSTEEQLAKTMRF